MSEQDDVSLYRNKTALVKPSALDIAVEFFLTGATVGVVWGGVFGAYDAYKAQLKPKDFALELGRQVKTYGVNLGLYLGMVSGLSVALQRQRQVDDFWNMTFAGTVTGAILFLGRTDLAGTAEEAEAARPEGKQAAATPETEVKQMKMKKIAPQPRIVVSEPAPSSSVDMLERLRQRVSHWRPTRNYIVRVGASALLSTGLYFLQGAKHRQVLV
eukprot:GILJ01005354.1.p1 GENE.GILJ01005354.1~~GILJ01005354.1.p1  ORF type:complete len:223 (-),score=27.31 GILJ01005354.1:136-777(-)